MSSYRMKYKIGATQYHIPVVDDISGFGSGIPLGTILPYSANTLNPPYGFLFCDGSAISRAMYPDLFDLIGTLYGLGDGSTTFNLPDLTSGKFLEGTNSAGTSKSAGLPNITASNGNGYNLLVGAGGIDSGSYSGAFYAEGKGYGAYGGAVDSTYPPYSSQLRFDASRCSSIYGNSQTVQPSSVTVRYIIKAYDAPSASSSEIDISQYANALNQKLTENDIYGNNFTIVYPNNGTAENPANVSVNSTYYIDNPFPGYLVSCQVELFYNNEWGVCLFGQQYDSGGNVGHGAYCFQHNNGNLTLRTGLSRLMYSNYYTSAYPNTWPSGGTHLTSAPCRVKVWKIGKIPQSS